MPTIGSSYQTLFVNALAIMLVRGVRTVDGLYDPLERGDNAGMRRDWEPEGLIASWTLVDDDWRLVANKTGSTRLGFALLLKFFEIDARFPRHAGEVPLAAIAYVAGQVKVPAEAFAAYDWSGRTVIYHRAQIRTALGFREAGREDEDRLTSWLAEEICPVELSEERRREALLIRCRADRIEPPGRIERMLGAALAMFEQQFCQQTVARLSAEAIIRLEALVTNEEEPDTEASGIGRSFLVELKADPGQLGLETLVNEIDKLERVRGLGLPADLFTGVSEKLVAAWRARAVTQYPSHLRASARPVRLTLLAALCWMRTSEQTRPRPWLVDLSEAVARSARLQIRACDFHRTRLLSHPILGMDAPVPRGAGALAVRGFRHPCAPLASLDTTPALRVTGCGHPSMRW